MKKLWIKFKVAWAVIFNGTLRNLEEVQALLDSLPTKPLAKIVGDRGATRLVEFRFKMMKPKTTKKKKHGVWPGGQVL